MAKDKETANRGFSRPFNSKLEIVAEGIGLIDDGVDILWRGRHTDLGSVLRPKVLGRKLGIALLGGWVLDWSNDEISHGCPADRHRASYRVHIGRKCPRPRNGSMRDTSGGKRGRNSGAIVGLVCKRWQLGVGRIDPVSAEANALSCPPGEYACKSEAQRN